VASEQCHPEPRMIWRNWHALVERLSQIVDLGVSKQFPERAVRRHQLTRPLFLIESAQSVQPLRGLGALQIGQQAARSEPGIRLNQSTTLRPFHELAACDLE
jgi:hypothetical protein